jgi:hypothetical protein
MERKHMPDQKPYRPNVGIALFNADGRVLIGHRFKGDGPEIILPGLDWQMPQGGVGLDVSHRKSPGADHSTLVSHGMKTSPVKIELLLFRDQSLGYKDGQRVGKDWWYEWEKIKDKLIAKLEKRGALSVSYPTLAAVGCDSLIFTHIGLPQPKGIGMFVVDLEAYDPRTIKDGGSKKVVKQLEKIGSRAAPSPQRQADAAATVRVKAGSSADALSSWTQAVAPPSSSRRGR